MPPLNAKRFSPRILALCVAGSLTACVHEPTIVERTRDVEIRVPVVQPIDARLSADCAPAFQYGEKVTVDDVISRLMAVETALSQCRGQLTEIRK